MHIVLHVLVSLSAFFLAISSNSVEAGDRGASSCPDKPFHAPKISDSTQPIALSPPLLRQLAEKDEIIYAVVQINYNNTPENKFCHQAVRYLRHFELTAGSLILHFHEDGEVPYRPLNVAWNPLATYHLMNRFHTILKPLFMMLSETDEHQYSLARHIRSVMGDLGWPTEDDIRSTTSAILRIQYVYDLNTTDLSRGIIAGAEYGIPLFFDDCTAIAKQAQIEGYFYLAVEWFEEALRVLGSDPHSGDAIQRKIAENNIELARRTHDEEYDKYRPSDPMFFLQKLSQEPINIERRRTYLQRDLKTAAKMKSYGALYRALCSGENLKSKEEESRLFCYFETKLNPAWSINPLKVEILSLKSLLVVQYHQLLSESRVEHLRSTSRGQLRRSVVHGTASLTSRTSMFARIDDSLHDYSYIPRTIELITGLRVGRKDRDGLQVVAYSAGNHYKPHTDVIGWSEVEDMGLTATALNLHRIGTFIFYLSDVIQGGATAFPLSGVAVSPQKGSAIMWYNLLKSSELDPSTWHGSCPVIIGEKWIANRWILGNQQVVNPRYKCGKDANASIAITVNGRPIEVVV